MKMGIVAATAAVVGLSSSAAMAANVYINGAGITNLSELSGQTRGNAKFRISAANFDQSIDNAAAVIAPASQVTHNHGNVAQISGDTFTFVLQHIAGTGFKLTMQNVTDNAPAHTVAWGSFAAAPATTIANDLQGILPDRSFNGLLIEARAQSNPSLISFSNLTFSSGAVTQNGSLVAGASFDQTQGFANPFTGNNENGRLYQTIASDIDLSTIDWTISANVALTRTGAGDGEAVRFNVAFKNFDFDTTTIIPLPTPVTMAGAGLLMLAGVRRRYN